MADYFIGVNMKNYHFKIEFFEKATKIGNYHPLDLMFTKNTSNLVDDKSQFLWPSQKS